MPIGDAGLELDWTLALAGGDGVRLQDYVASRFGMPIPKQYCSLIGDRSMLEHTLDRMNQITPPWRTMTVIGRDHGQWARLQLAGRSDHVFCQPASRGTGLALYVALAKIMRRHPDAIVTITPTDHYVAPAARYLEAVVAARTWAAEHRELVVLLGVPPTEPDPELGYVVLGQAPSGAPDVRSVAAFVEKPSISDALELSRAGALWSTMVACGSASALWELGRAAEPQMIDILDSLVPLVGTPDEDEAIDHIYRACLPVNFSLDICERATERLVAMPIFGIEWSDLGKPERVERVLASRSSRARPVAAESAAPAY